MVNPELEHTAWTWQEMETVPCDLCGSVEHRLEVVEDVFRMVRCVRCGLVFCNPRPTRAEMLRFYEQYFQPESEKLWEEQMREPFRREGVEFLTSVLKPGRVLDVGCAHGFFLDMMRKARWEAEGVEPSPAAARYARDTLALKVHCGLVEDAPLDPQSFDAATMWYVLEHVPNPSEVLCRVASLLRPGGYLIVRVPNRNVEVDRILAKLGRLGRRFFVINPPRHLYDYSPETLGRLLEKAGFEVVRIANSLPRSAGSIPQRLRRRLWYWKAEVTRALTGGRCLSGSSLTVCARKVSPQALPTERRADGA